MTEEAELQNINFRVFMNNPEDEKEYFKKTEIDKNFNKNIQTLQHHVINFYQVLRYFHNYGDNIMNDHLLEMEDTIFSDLFNREMVNFNRRIKMIFGEFIDEVFKIFSGKMNRTEPCGMDQVFSVNRRDSEYYKQLDRGLENEIARGHYNHLIQAKEDIAIAFKHNEFLKKAAKMNPKTYDIARRRVQLFCSMNFSKFLPNEELQKANEEVLKALDLTKQLRYQPERVESFAQADIGGETGEIARVEKMHRNKVEKITMENTAQAKELREKENENILLLQQLSIMKNFLKKKGFNIEEVPFNYTLPQQTQRNQKTLKRRKGRKTMKKSHFEQGFDNKTMKTVPKSLEKTNGRNEDEEYNNGYKTVFDDPDEDDRPDDSPDDSPNDSPDDSPDDRHDSSPEVEENPFNNSILPIDN